ncbi:MAG: hypothetical protein HPY67_12390 [Syntrophaceae bacterium]|nr:hypothetical protein [Syntrophaceae bacterium]
MKARLRYEPPLLVDMRARELCGKFSACFSGGYAGAGMSCYEDSSCKSGTYAERCQTGVGACGCDACCQTGSLYQQTGGYVWTECECKPGSQAQTNCNDGSYTGGPCTNYGNFAGGSTCSLYGTYVYYSCGTQNCCAGA